MYILENKLCTNQLATKGGGKQAFESHYLGRELGLETQTTSGIHFFLWLSLHNSVPVCELSGSIGLNLSTGCSIVNESIVHVLDNCFFTRFYWTRIQFNAWKFETKGGFSVLNISYEL